MHVAHPGMRLVATDLGGRVVEAHAPEALHDLDPAIAHERILAFLQRLRERHPQRRVLAERDGPVPADVR